MGVPNTLNVMTNFPFLIIGVLGFVLCIGGSFFNISLKGEIWGWTLFYAGIASFAFGSAFYHLKPDDNRIVLGHFAFFLVERAGETVGLSCLALLLFTSFLSVAYASMTFQLILCPVIPVMTGLLPPKYTHSSFWLWATAAYAIAKIDGLAQTTKYTMQIGISSVGIHWGICVQPWLRFYLPLCFCTEAFGFIGNLFLLALFCVWTMDNFGLVVHKKKPEE